MREEHTQVMVVGAGPVGLTAALILAQAGIQVQVLDREERTAARSYACALHPGVMALLDKLGVMPPLLECGRKVQKIGFYDGKERKAELDLQHLGGKFPFLLIIPQNALEGELARRFEELSGTPVLWSHRFDDVNQEQNRVICTIEKLAGSSRGYIVPHWETVVQKRFEVSADFLIGADGCKSLVRQRLGFQSTLAGNAEAFAAYEYESDTPTEDEVRVVLDANTTNVLWPLPGNKSRWTFQIQGSEAPAEFPDKERRAIHIADARVDDDLKEYVQKVAHERAPWFVPTTIREITWCTDVFFERRVVNQFGKGRCWLAGDAAHQTGPAGAQSMNFGMLEAETLATGISRVLKENAPVSSLASYDQSCQSSWRQVLGLSGPLKAKQDAKPWAKERAARLLPCVPASGSDFGKLAAQLALGF